jgi:hypothetical protein
VPTSIGTRSKIYTIIASIEHVPVGGGHFMALPPVAKEAEAAVDVQRRGRAELEPRVISDCHTAVPLNHFLTGSYHIQ